MPIYVAFVLATPGIDGLPKGFLDSQQKKDKLAETVRPLVHVAADDGFESIHTIIIECSGTHSASASVEQMYALW